MTRGPIPVNSHAALERLMTVGVAMLLSGPMTQGRYSLAGRAHPAA